MDTVSIARDVLGSSVANYRLETLTRYFGISEKQSHRALPDARLTASLYIKLNEKLDSAN
jgi:DNA polymerase III epsilon subunit-like protein